MRRVLRQDILHIVFMINHIQKQLRKYEGYGCIHQEYTGICV